jgi:hypothetical protein
VIFRRKNQPVISQNDLNRRQKEADQAVIMSSVGLMAAKELDAVAKKVQIGHILLQTENHFGPKMFGVEIDAR